MPNPPTSLNLSAGAWSVHDILAHLLAWQRLLLDWYQAGRRGDKPESKESTFHGIIRAGDGCSIVS